MELFGILFIGSKVLVMLANGARGQGDGDLRILVE
jgi:hypothetical protein